MPEKITANYRIVTPMFIGDAEQKASGISPASVKGALRFWWRALNWGKCLNKVNSDVTIPQNDKQAAALRELHVREAKLFGGLPKTVKNEQTGKDETLGGQGAFLLRVVPDNIKLSSAKELDNTHSLKGAWQSYLLGLGLMQQNHYLPSRSAIVSGSFSVQLYCKNSEYLKELENLLLLWGLLGGLGSRQRKGLGSISITALKVGDEIRELPQNQPAVLDVLKMRIDKSATGEPPYTAFSRSAQILCSPSSHQKPWQKLGEIAKDMQKFRGWGFSVDGIKLHKINGELALPKAYPCKQTDHGIVYDYTKAVPPKQLPKSITFGLPRAYKLSNGGGEFKLDVLAYDKNGKEEKINKRSRRASPVFIHIHQFPNNDNESMIIQSFLPATFLPATDKIQIKQTSGGTGQWDVSPSSPTDWQVIDDYLKLTAFSTWDRV